MDYYTYKAYRSLTNESIIRLTKESCGIRSIARLLRIGTTTVLRKIKAIAKQLSKPLISFGKEYELDELCTYVKARPESVGSLMRSGKIPGISGFFNRQQNK